MKSQTINAPMNMKFRKVFLLIGFVVISLQANTQQLSQFTHYMFRPSLYNPAASGLNDALCIYGAGRNQWIGFKDENGNAINPVVYQAGFAMPVYAINSGVGFTFEFNRLGYLSGMNFRLDYAYHFKLENDQKISAGLSFQMNKTSLDMTKLSALETGDPLIMQAGEETDWVPDAGIGLMFTGKDRYYAGISFMNFLGSKAELENVELPNQPTFIAQGMYKISVVKERRRSIEVAPAFLVKSYLEGTQVDLNVLGYFNSQFWLGTGYRLQDGIILLGGIQAKNLKVGLSYDFTTGQVQKATSGGTAEIHLSYCIPMHAPDKSTRPTTTNGTRINNKGTNRKIPMKSKFNTRDL